MEFYFGGLVGTLIKFADFDICKLFVDLAKVHSVRSYCSRAKCYKSCLFLHFDCDLECRHRLLFMNTGERVDRPRHQRRRELTLPSQLQHWESFT